MVGHEILRRTPGIARVMTTVAIRLRAPAIAAGGKSMDLIRTPPRDQRIAAASRSRTCLFNTPSEYGLYRMSLTPEEVKLAADSRSVFVP